MIYWVERGYMKKSELKQLIEPIVKECVNENIQAILLESGLLSQVISEVVKGLQPVLVESKQQVVKESFTQPTKQQTLLRKANETKANLDNEELLKSRMSFRGINIFEGVDQSIPDEPVSSKPGNPMSGIAPNDPGVDISGLFNPQLAAALMKGKKA